MNTSKESIEKIVRDYIILCPQEFESFKKANQEKMSLAADSFSEIKGSDLITRKLFEIPETLHAMLKVRLALDDWEWFRTKEGSIWFATKFNDFRSSEKV